MASLVAMRLFGADASRLLAPVIDQQPQKSARSKSEQNPSINVAPTSLSMDLRLAHSAPVSRHTRQLAGAAMHLAR